MTNILIINGPNLNLLGTRQPEVYGRTTLADIETLCRAHAAAHSAELSFFQSNIEGELIDRIHQARGSEQGIIINAGAYTHTSIALMDALISVDLPAIEVHMSNIHAREQFRHVSYISKAVIGQLCGFGAQGYVFALDALIARLTEASDV